MILDNDNILNVPYSDEFASAQDNHHADRLLFDMDLMIPLNHDHLDIFGNGHSESSPIVSKGNEHESPLNDLYPSLFEDQPNTSHHSMLGGHQQQSKSPMNLFNENDNLMEDIATPPKVRSQRSTNPSNGAKPSLSLNLLNEPTISHFDGFSRDILGESSPFSFLKSSTSKRSADHDALPTQFEMSPSFTHLPDPFSPHSMSHTNSPTQLSPSAQLDHAYQQCKESLSAIQEDLSYKLKNELQAKRAKKRKKPSSRSKSLEDNRPRKRLVLSKAKKKVLTDWLFNHASNPYPTEEEKLYLREATGQTKAQLDNWFVNARKRMLEKSPTPPHIRQANEMKSMIYSVLTTCNSSKRGKTKKSSTPNVSMFKLDDIPSSPLSSTITKQRLEPTC